MKVSIIIPCYNARKYIEESAKSAFYQDYKDFEVIIVDNDSTDGTKDKIEEIKKKYPSCISGSAPNIYPNCWDEARRVGINMATGDYVAVLAADDYIEEDYISNCMHIMMTNPDKIQAIQSPIRAFRTEYDGLRPSKQYIETISHKYKSLDEFKRKAMRGCPVTTPSFFFKKSLDSDGLLPTNPLEYSGAADYDMYCFLADSGVFIYPVPHFLGYWYRIHDKQATWQMHKSSINYDKKIKDFWRSKWSLE